MKFLTAFLLTAAVAAAQIVSPGASSVSTGGGGGSGNYNPGSVAITGGDVSNVSGTNDTWTTPSLFGVTTVYGTWAYVPAPMAALAIDTSKKLNTLTITAGTTGYPNVTLTFNSAPLISSQEFGARILNNTGTAVVITYPTSWSYNKGATATTFTIQPNSYVRLNWDYDLTNYYISGDPTQVAYRSLNWNVYNSGSVLVAGQAHYVVYIPSASTLVGWEVSCYPSGSVAFNVFMATASTSIAPSVSIFGSSTFPSITSGTSSLFSSMHGGDTTAVAAGNGFDMSVTGTPATCTQAILTLYYAPTL
jgi:hypothetical protein